MCFRKQFSPMLLLLSILLLGFLNWPGILKFYFIMLTSSQLKVWTVISCNGYKALRSLRAGRLLRRWGCGGARRRSSPLAGEQTRGCPAAAGTIARHATCRGSAHCSLPRRVTEQAGFHRVESGWLWSLSHRSAFGSCLSAEREGRWLSHLCCSVTPSPSLAVVEVTVPPALAARVAFGLWTRRKARAHLQRRLYTEQLEASVMKVSSEKTEKREDRQEKRRKNRHKGDTTLYRTTLRIYTVFLLKKKK